MSQRLSDQSNGRTLYDAILANALRDQAKGPRYRALFEESDAASEAFDQLQDSPDHTDEQMEAAQSRYARAFRNAHWLAKVWTIEQIKAYESGAPFEWADSFR